jgi:hypothetical protein
LVVTSKFIYIYTNIGLFEIHYLSEAAQ